MHTLLIVDDDPAVVDTIVRALHRYPTEFSTHTAYNGADAIRILETEQIDLVSTDLTMPVLSGFHLLAYMLNQYPTIPVVIATASDISVLYERMSQRGFRSITYLQKPFSLKYYVATIREQLNHLASGHIQPIDLFDIFHLLKREQKTCILRVYSQHGEGSLSFIDGDVVHAWCDDMVGAEAIATILNWNDLRVEARDAPAGGHRTIDPTLSRVLHELHAMHASAPPPLHEDHARAFNNHDPAAQFLETSVPGDMPPTVPVADTPPGDTVEAADLGSATRKDVMMANVKQALEEAMQIDGAVGVALVDYQSGMSLGTAGGNDTLNLEVAAAGNTDVVRAKMKVMTSLGLKDTIEDILITLGTQYHLIRLLRSSPGLFLYLVLSKSQANLAMSRHRLAQIEANLSM